MITPASRRRASSPAASRLRQRPRVHREEHGAVSGERDQAVRDGGQLRRVVDERGAVQRHERVAAGLDAELLPAAARAGGVEVLEQRVDHRVADEVDAGCDPLALEVRDRLLRVREQDVADVVGEDAVVLLRHRPVEAAQARLDVRDLDAELDGGERARERRVDVAGDDAEVDLALHQHPLDPDQRLRRLLAVRSRADAEELVRPRHPELAEEDVRHRVVVVLPRMQEHELQGGIERGQLPVAPEPTS